MSWYLVFKKKIESLLSENLSFERRTIDTKKLRDQIDIQGENDAILRFRAKHLIYENLEGVVGKKTERFLIEFEELQDALSLGITLDIPADTPPEKIQNLVRQASLKANAVHRANGGHGLKVDAVEITADSLVPEGVQS